MNKKSQKFSWWIEFLTNELNQQRYIYYFEVFEIYYQAKKALDKYIQYLSQKHSEIINIQIEQSKPKELTIHLTLFPVCLWRFEGKQPPKWIDNRLNKTTSHLGSIPSSHLAKLHASLNDSSTDIEQQQKKETELSF